MSAVGVSDIDFPIGLDVVGVAVGAVQGALFAYTRTRVSVVGVGAFALVTAVGGAVIRDAMLAVPSAALTTVYLITWISATVVALAIAHWEHRLAAALTILDAVYLGIWTVAGADKAIHLKAGVPAVVVLGVITGVGGGVVRDVLASQVPTLFLGGPLYTLAALAGSVAFAALHYGPLPRPVDATVAALLVVAIRLVSLYKRWLLPAASDMSPMLSRSWSRREPPDQGSRIRSS